MCDKTDYEIEFDEEMTKLRILMRDSGINPDMLEDDLLQVGLNAAEAVRQFGEAVKRLRQSPGFIAAMEELVRLEDEEESKESYGYTVAKDEEE